MEPVPELTENDILEKLLVSMNKISWGANGPHEDRKIWNSSSLIQGG